MRRPAGPIAKPIASMRLSELHSLTAPLPDTRRAGGRRSSTGGERGIEVSSLGGSRGKHFSPGPPGPLARARGAVKKHPEYSEHEYFVAVETAFKGKAM